MLLDTCFRGTGKDSDMGQENREGPNRVDVHGVVVGKQIEKNQSKCISQATTQS
jgi:hypothetical protein